MGGTTESGLARHVRRLFVTAVLATASTLVAPAVAGATVELKKLKVCVLSGSAGQAVVAQRVKPKPAVRLFKRVSFLLQSLQSGLCEAVVYDAPSLATLRARVPSRYGGFAGVLRTRESYAVALTKGSTLTAQVNAALAALKADGTLRRLEKRWLAVGLSGLRVLT